MTTAGGRPGRECVTLTGRVRWHGFYKLEERQAELLMLMGKLGSYPDMDKANPDGKQQLDRRLVEAMGAVHAALDFFAEANFTPELVQAIAARRERKLEQFRMWHALEGMPGLFIVDHEGAEGSVGCTGPAASWCPRCGDCQCPRLHNGERESESWDCPLHGRNSPHGEP